MTNEEIEKLSKLRFFWFLGFLRFCPRIRILLSTLEYNLFCQNTTTFAQIQPLCPNTTNLPD